jgi:hypothetical protein
VAEAANELTSSLGNMNGSEKEQATRAIASTVLPGRTPASVVASPAPRGGSK